MRISDRVILRVKTFDEVFDVSIYRSTSAVMFAIPNLQQSLSGLESFERNEPCRSETSVLFFHSGASIFTLDWQGTKELH